MTFDDFLDKVLIAFPSATVSEDEDGQLIIHTGLHEIATGEIVALEDE